MLSLPVSFFWLNYNRLVNEALVNIELSHVIDNDSTSEIFLFVFGLQNMFHEGRFPGSQESA